MNYLALGDSISIDEYTETGSGGAASQFARLTGATQFQDLTRDGRTTTGVLAAWPEITLTPNVVTLTAGGNDFLQGSFQALNSIADWGRVASEPLGNLEEIAARLDCFRLPRHPQHRLRPDRRRRLAHRLFRHGDPSADGL